MAPSLTAYDLPFPQNGGSICPQDTRMAMSPQRVIRYISCLALGWGLRNGGSNGAISGSNKSKMAAAAILEKFQMAISSQLVARSTSCLVLGWGFVDGGSNGAVFDSNKSKMAAAAILEQFQMAISLQRLIRSAYIVRIARSSLR